MKGSICGARMTGNRARGEFCARGSGHKPPHRTAEGMERQREHKARRYASVNERRDKLVAIQEGICGCGDPLPAVDRQRGVVLDHDHSCCPQLPYLTCGECDRGALHAPCNRILGMANDSPERLRNLANYLEATKK